jgi:hypothetical protein
MDFRKCTKCGRELTLDKFYKTPKGYRGDCKECCSLKNSKFRELNPTYHKEYKKDYKNNNHYDYSEYGKTYYESNRKKVIAKVIARDKTRRLSDLSYRLKANLRSRARTAIKNQCGMRAFKSLELLGVSDIAVVRQHIESQFTQGMSWDNYGEWEIDHIIPCASFDLTNSIEQKKCFNYKNLQPLWKEDNLKKSDKPLERNKP